MKSFLGVSKIARITGKPRVTVLRWIQAGKFGKANKIGNEYQVSHEQFLGWWKRNMKASQ
ncbi:MAG: helix-turn-helix domain-containing protein [Anaerolineales bacterium]|nr:helix-turn-helix domain-containing protein [Anaerolineales bacterium]HRN51123.1 helix-turn-helix domain-containing protein [Anaerolineales bacterium]